MSNRDLESRDLDPNTVDAVTERISCLAFEFLSYGR